MFVRLIFACLLLVATARGQDFKVFKSFEKQVEGPGINLLLVDTAKQRFSMASPRGFILRADEAAKTLKFESPNGQSAIAVLFTTNSPSSLPKEEDLTKRLTNIYPGSVIVGTGACRTRPEAGLYFELKKSVSDNQSLMIYHAFVPNQEGLIELIFRSSGEAYKEEIAPFTFLITTFQAGPKPPPK